MSCHIADCLAIVFIALIVLVAVAGCVIMMGLDPEWGGPG